MLVPDGPLAEAPIGASWDGTRRDVIFNMFIEVRQNVSPVVPSAGSCVLLHRWVNPVTPTQGCTSFSKDGVETVLAWLSPQAHPVLVQLPEAELKRLAGPWGLPQ
jgi:L,D-peptidoglycan transpeptidase YkuD (ErfK/YbiS/YcfS/YnhG family)